MGCLGEELSTEKLAAVPPAVSPKPHNPSSPCITPVPSELPFLHGNSECMSVRFFLCWCIKWTSGFQAFSSLTQKDGILTDFSRQILNRFLSFQWSSRLGNVAPLRGALQLSQTSRFSTIGLGREGSALFASLPFLPVSVWLLCIYLVI